MTKIAARKTNGDMKEPSDIELLVVMLDSWSRFSEPQDVHDCVRTLNKDELFTEYFGQDDFLIWPSIPNRRGPQSGSLNHDLKLLEFSLGCLVWEDESSSFVVTDKGKQLSQSIKTSRNGNTTITSLEGACSQLTK